MTTPAETIEQLEPYQGLRPYTEKDKAKFFGRDADCKILIDKILANKLTLLFAASGVGKSSLLQAGVLPQLKDPKHENLDAVYFNDWVSPPLAGLKQVVLHYLKQERYLDPTIPQEHIPLNHELKELLGFCALFTRQPLILILDQFEEFFRYQRYLVDYKPFIQQLSAAITDRDTPIAVVISMREDFALELNEFKPHLPTLLFENFYRLERLTCESAYVAIETPIKHLGYRYENRLISKLLKDLSAREARSHSASPIAELIDTVEPAYLQIVCSQLWEVNKNDPEKTLRYATYEGRGTAKGLLESYVKDTINQFSTTEQGLASQAFNHLVTRRGAKMAYTVDALAKAIEATPAQLAKVLERLEQGRILRSQSRQGERWYELYHDLFSNPIEQWNDVFKTKERNRRAVIATASFLIAGVILYALYDVGVNYTNQHLRLSVKPEVSNTIEVYRGKSNSRDLFHLQGYQTETGYLQAQIESDKLFTNKPISTFDDLNSELIGSLPLIDRIEPYWEDGQHDKALELASKVISNKDEQRSYIVIDKLGSFRSIKTIQFIHTYLQGGLPGSNKLAFFSALSPDRLGSREAVALLIALLKDSDPNVRGSAAYALAELGGPEAIASLIALLEDNDIGVRAMTASSLGRLGSPEAVTPLIALLKDTDPGVRSMAADALAQLRSPEAVAPLIALLKDNDIGVRMTTVDTLGRLGGPEAVTPLIALLEDNEPNVRITTMNALARLGSPEAVRPLIALLKDTDTTVRSSAANTLATLGSPEAVTPLIALLKDTYTSVRASAANALARLGRPEAVAPLIALLKDSDTTMRDRVADALADLGSPSVAPLIALLEDTDPNVRSSAADALAKLGRPEAVTPLITLLKDLDVDVRNSAAYALAQLRSPEAVTPLIALLKDSDTTMRDRPANALAELESPEAVAPLVALLKHADPNVRSSAADALAKLGRPEAVTPLITLLKDVDPNVRNSAAYALAQLGNPEAVALRDRAADALTEPGSPEALLKQPSQGTQIRPVSRKLDDSQSTELLALLDNENINVKVDAIERLGEANASIATPKLKSLLADPNIRIRRAVLDSLSKLNKEETIAAILEMIKQKENGLGPRVYDLISRFQVKQALPFLTEQLTRLEKDYAQWRNIRDEVRDDFTDEQLNDWKQRIEDAKPKTYLNLQLGSTLARIDPNEWGVKLLGHDLAKVREGAWMGLGQVGNVPLLQQLYKEWLGTDNPIYRHAAYRAMDHILIRMESDGSKDDIAALKAFLQKVTEEIKATQVQATPSAKQQWDKRDAVATRVEWTFKQREWRAQRQQQTKIEHQ